MRVIIILSIANFITLSYCSSFHIIDDLLASYDKRVRPDSGGDAVLITSQLTVAALGPFNEQTFTYEVDFYLRHWWNDPRLRYNDSSIEEISTNSQPEAILWTPLLSIVNARSVRKYDDAVRTVIHRSGQVYVSRRLRAVVDCEMDLTYYPMDTQICQMTFESFTFGNVDMKLVWHAQSISGLDIDSMKTTGYVIKDVYTDFRSVDLVYGTTILPYDNLIVYFKVKRTFLYFVYRAYIPTILLMIFNTASYWIPATAVPARVTLIVTTFLASTFILQSVSEQTVKVTYTTPMQMFLLVNLLLIVVSVIEFVAVLYIKHSFQKSDPTQTSQANPAYIDRTHDSNGIRNGNTKHIFSKKRGDLLSLKVDMIFRTSVPIFYIIFCAIYFTYYLVIV